MESEDSKASGCGSKQQFALIKGELERTLPYLPKHHLVEIRKMVMQTFRKRFQRSRIPKYGSLNKGFTEQELAKFFKVIDNEKFRLLFSYQAQLGLRIGEAVRINIKDIKFESRELVVKTEKAMTLDTLLIPAQLFQATLSFIEEHSSDIEKVQGCLFFKEEGKSRLEVPHVAENYVRNRFRYYAEKSGLSEVYDQSDELKGRVPRSLHRLTTHSLRHYAITKFAEQTNGNVFLTSKFARHTKPATTMIYISTNKKALYDGIDGAFSTSEAMSLRNRLAGKRSVINMERNST
jgi:integrase